MRKKQGATRRNVRTANDDNGLQLRETSEMPVSAKNEKYTNDIKKEKKSNSFLSRSRERRGKIKGTAIDARCVLPVNLKEYFVERDGDAFRSLFAKTLKLGTLTFDDGPESLLRFEEEEEKGSSKSKKNEKIVVRLVTRPDLASWVPASVRHAVASAAEIEFHDEIEYGSVEMEKPPFCLYVRTRSPFLGTKFNLESRLTFSRLEDGRCEQRLQGRVEVRMLGLGGLVERMVRDSVQNTYKKLPRVIGLWNQERRKILARDEGNGAGLVHGRPEHIDCGVEWIRDVVERMKSGSSPFAVDEYEEQIVAEVDGGGGKQMKEAMAASSADVDAYPSRAEGLEIKFSLLCNLSNLFYSMWIEFVDLCRLLCLVFIVVLLRLGLLTGGRRPAVERPVERRRHLAAWSTVAKVRHHRRECSAPDLPDVEEILRATHVRRASTESASELFERGW
eukprot:jgi/Picsp_1/2449/NSC_05910-R1_hypothetical protein CHLNCDRAFT_142876 [Chlorella variabilis]